MTIKELLEKSVSPVFIVEGTDKFSVTPWNSIYTAFSSCVVDTIDANEDKLEITLKKELVRENT